MVELPSASRAHAGKSKPEMFSTHGGTGKVLAGPRSHPVVASGSGEADGERSGGVRVKYWREDGRELSGEEVVERLQRLGQRDEVGDQRPSSGGVAGRRVGE